MQHCWKCQKPQRLVALMAEYIEQTDLDDPEEVSEGPFMFKYIEDLPPSLLHSIRKIQPNFEKEYSRTIGESYFMNICECEAVFGDYFIHKPGYAFWPISEHDAEAIVITEFTTESDISIEAEYSYGDTPKFILEHATRSIE